MANTTNLNLEEASGSTKLKNFPTPYNSNLGKIDRFAGKFNNLSVDFTYDSGVDTNGKGLVIKRSGKVVSVSGYVKMINAPGNSATTIATITNAANRPQNVIRTIGGIATNPWDVPVPCYVSFDPTGTINVTASSGNAYKSVYVNATYICAE